MNVLVVEDEQRLARLLKRMLEDERHTVEVAYDGATALELGLRDSFDLAVLDRMLPDLDGVEVCRRLRAARIAMPILMLTARGAVEDRVTGLNAGADDYLVKPFAMDELLARINALLRRGGANSAATVLQVGDLTLDLLRREVKRGGAIIELTPKEFALLEYLMRNPGHVLSRSQIVDHVWSYDFDALSNVVDIYIHYLRDKIDRGRGKPLIKTVRGAGYRIEG
ncbi:MAG TPA: response regulator transcription factor [Thermomicrobiaceae bacterium]|nr:response regulator transcription factor [Thermomicrobiaceae bacterium]